MNRGGERFTLDKQLKQIHYNLTTAKSTKQLQL
jgi:hypothetical protein